VPVHYSGGASVNISNSTPIKNLGTKGTVSFTGSVIKATNGGAVSINSPIN
jgi:hypothetical protein